MLADIAPLVRFLNDNPSQMSAIMAAVSPGNPKIEETAIPGVYFAWSLDNRLQELALVSGRMKVNAFPDLDDYKATYGVADFIGQVVDHFAAEIADKERAYVVGLSWMRKDQQPESGGWRWHKWGPYIGTAEPQFEYLYDEPEIEKVLIFSLIELDANQVRHIPLWGLEK